MKTVCIYHSADLDGICSAAIVNKFFKKEDVDVEFVGWNYGQPIPWEKLDGNQVIMVDLSFQPFDLMIELKDRAGSLIWIDHHKSAIEDAEKNQFDVDGLLTTKKAACELTWEYFSKDYMPDAIKLLGMYDSWRWTKEDKDIQDKVLNFQYGMRVDNFTPKTPYWELLLDTRYFNNMLSEVNFVIRNGEVVRKYEQTQNEKCIKSLGFEAEFNGFRAVCVNRGGCTSQLFDSVWDPEKYDLMVPFVYKNGSYTVSLYSTKPEIDCSAIAKLFGGGGHVGAAGMQVSVEKFFGLLSNIQPLKRKETNK
jgi:oligoribonuclease NrnB/cAMP/cGMP phosphodiesterase (DHH superfamily)